MSWTKTELSHLIANAEKVTVAVRHGKPRGTWSVRFTFGRSLVNEIGWTAGRRLAVYLGTGREHQGWIKFVPDEVGALLTKAKGNCGGLSVHLPSDALKLFVTHPSRAAVTQHTISGVAVLVRIPRLLLPLGLRRTGADRRRSADEGSE